MTHFGNAPRIKYYREEHLSIKRIDHYTLTIEDQLPPGFIYTENPPRSSEVLVKVAIDPTLEEGFSTTAVKMYTMDRSGFPTCYYKEENVHPSDLY